VSLVPVARVLRAHGVRGELRVKLYNPDSAALQRGVTLVLRPSSGAEQAVTVRAARPARGELIIGLQGVEDRNRAEALRGAELLVRREALPVPEPGSYYVFDLEGCAVVDRDSGQPQGRVAGVDNHGAHDLLRVHQGETEWLLPFVDAYVVDVDLEGRTIHTVGADQLVALATQTK
jgi:16S rRNA processing protein RimM